MDLHVCFWDKEKCCVVTCYYNSEFLGKASAQHLYEKFIFCLLKIEPNKLLQVSWDGPNVNLVFLDILNRFREDNEQPHLVNIGTCRLHTLHNAFKNDEKASGWNTIKLLMPMYKILMNLLRVEETMKIGQCLNFQTTHCNFALIVGWKIKMWLREPQKYGRKLLKLWKKVYQKVGNRNQENKVLILAMTTFDWQ